jgi:hypothetical protein
VTGYARMSADGRYRYTLTRRWGDGPPMVWIMLNPSTADHILNDPTIARVINFTAREGRKALTVVNLFAYRATNPADLLTVDEPIGPDNDEAIALAVEDQPTVVAAWGAHGSMASRDRAVMRLLASAGVEPVCLGVTITGMPRHPLRLHADTPLIPYTRKEGDA